MSTESRYILFLRISVSSAAVCTIRLDYRLGSSPFGSDAPRPLDGPFVSHNLMSSHGNPVPLLKLQMAPILRLWTSSAPSPPKKKRNPIFACLGEVRASHSHKMCLRFLSLLHASYIKGYWSAPLKMSSQGVMSSKEVSNNWGLCPVKGQMYGFCNWIRVRDELLCVTFCWNYLLQEFWNNCSFTGCENKCNYTTHVLWNCMTCWKWIAGW